MTDTKFLERYDGAKITVVFGDGIFALTGEAGPMQDGVLTLTTDDGTLYDIPPSQIKYVKWGDA